MKRTGPSGKVDGVGYVRQGGIHSVPAALKGELLAAGGWQLLDARQRVTEPAPADYSAFTVRELREQLSEAGVPVPAGAVKADLIRLLQGR